jgi:CCR4-NOT transcription complex subunit 1 CAF1-binding domain
VIWVCLRLRFFFVFGANIARPSVLAQEPNFHGLYLELLSKLGDNKATSLLVATTHKYIRILLRSERIKTQTGERSLLKNLGSWLGKLTLARDKPLREKDLSLKGIIFQAYEEVRSFSIFFMGGGGVSWGGRTGFSFFWVAW